MIEITESAAGKIKEIMASQNNENAVLRLYVAGFG
jgi:Fe-S cluster assembly iron-binding protein IscA